MRLIALTVTAAVLALVACTAPTIEGSPLGGNRALPNRDTSSGDDDDDDSTATTPAKKPAPVTTAVSQPQDAGPPPSKACTITNTALCFTFEGTANDFSSDGLEPTVDSGITFVKGHENEAAQFTATSKLEFAANSALELPAGAATIEAWINRQDTGGDAAVFDDDGRFSLTIQANGTMICKSSGGAVAGITPITAGVWHHVACVIDGGTQTAYLDGAVEHAGAGSIASNPSLTASIGANAPPGSPEGDQVFIGLIDSFRLFNVARSATDIASDAAGL